MDIEKAFSYNNKEMICSAFYELCSKDSQSIPIKRLFLKLELRDKFDCKVLSHGLLGALEHNQEKYVPIIFDFIAKHKVEPDFSALTDVLLTAIDNKKKQAVTTFLDYMHKNGLADDNNLKHLQYIFNYAHDTNEYDLAKQLDDKYSIVKRSMNEDMHDSIVLQSGAHCTFAILKQDGSLETSGIMGGELTDKEARTDYYLQNPILFNLKNFNPDLLDSFFKPDYEINPSVITHGLIMNVCRRNSEAVLYLFSNEKISNIIKNSNEIKAFINNDEDEDFSEQKKEARIALSMIELKDGLSDDNAAKNKLKI